MKLLLYCTKAKPYLVDERKIRYNNFVLGDKSVVNGKILAECDYEVEEIELKMEYMGLYYCGKTVNGWSGSLCEESQLDNWQLLDYLGDKIGDKGYAIHIKNLHIFDEPRELNDFYKFVGIDKDINNFKSIEKAPQNMMYAYEYTSEIGFSGTWNRMLNSRIIISIRPEWLCKILNGEKTIEVRKKVLKEMIK